MKAILLLFFPWICPSLLLAMKPAPFKPVSYQDPITKYKVKSVQKPNELTEVSDPYGKILWSIPQFVGRQEIHLSPDGRWLALVGSLYFAKQIQLSKEAEVVQIFREGTRIKTVFVRDLFAEEPKALEEKLKLQVKGGGWIPVEALVKQLKLDWASESVGFALQNQTEKWVVLSENLKAHWISNCQVGGKSLALHSKSRSGDPFEDDMTLKLRTENGDANVSVGTGLFSPIPVQRTDSVCDMTFGVPMGSNQILVFFEVDRRPGLSALGAILVDLSSLQVLDLSKNLGAMFPDTHPNQIRFEKNESGLRVYLAQGWNKAAKTDSDKEVLMGWALIKIENSNISARWEKPLPETHKSYSKPDVAPAL